MRKRVLYTSHCLPPWDVDAQRLVALMPPLARVALEDRERVTIRVGRETWFRVFRIDGQVGWLGVDSPAKPWRFLAWALFKARPT
jgi:hypothetical protein